MLVHAGHNTYINDANQQGAKTMTNQPKIVLKSIKVHTGLSQETPAYAAKLFVDGKAFALVRNDGHGGCDYVDPLHRGYRELETRLKELEARIAETFPKHDMSDMGDGSIPSMDESLEMICHSLVWEHVDQRNMKSRLSRTVMTFEGGEVYTWKGKKDEARMDRIATQKPEAIILNRLPFDEAWELLKNVA